MWRRTQQSANVPLVIGSSCASRVSAVVIDRLIELQQQGRDAPENLFVYFSVHGFRAHGETMKLEDLVV
jgi:uncharacterized membrane protein